jgi:hypothetical protein
LAAADGVLVYAPSLDEIARRWAEIEPLLRRATDRTIGYEPIDVLQRVLTSRMGLWLITSHDFPMAVAVTEIVEYPRVRTLQVPFIAGRGLRHWHKQLLTCLDNQAHLAGCTMILGFDRKGWSRFGFEATGVTLQRCVPLLEMVTEDEQRTV